MSRPPIDQAARVVARLDPPAELKAATRKLWHREFDRFPPGFFTPSDVRGMLLYLDWIAIYDRAHRAFRRAKGEAALEWFSQLQQSAAKVITLQRALRMYPSTRVAAHAHGGMVRDAGVTPAPKLGREPWEDILKPLRPPN